MDPVFQGIHTKLLTTLPMCLCPVVVFCLPLHSRPIALHGTPIPMPDADCMGEVTEMFLSLRYVLFVFCGCQSCLCLCVCNGLRFDVYYLFLYVFIIFCLYSLISFYLYLFLL